MRILVLCKRRYTGKDLLTDRYGRLFEIPRNLSERGHDVRGVALDYHRIGWTVCAQDIESMRWLSVRALPTSLIRYTTVISRFIRDWPPDVIWASSDMLHVVLGMRIGDLQKTPVVLDLYDNYESFAAARLPGLARKYRDACAQAAGISVVSHSLASLLRAQHDHETRIGVVVNGVDKTVFYPRDKLVSRVELNLPTNAQLVGTAGSITADRGIEDMFEAFSLLAKRNDNVWLVFAGPRDHVPSLYKHHRVIDLGQVPTETVPTLLSSLDVAIVCNRDSSFGRYCFPMKLYEILACRVPIVAARVGDVADLLKPYPVSLYEPGDVAGLAERIERLLATPSGCELAIPSWSECASKLEDLLNAAASQGRPALA